MTNSNYINPVAELWLQALESGNYKQCKGRLFDGEGYCCLGVGAKIASDNLNLDLSKAINAQKLLVGELYFVTKSLGLRSAAGLSCGDTLALTELNDSEGFSFERIASILRNNPKNYFRSLELQQ